MMTRVIDQLLRDEPLAVFVTVTLLMLLCALLALAAMYRRDDRRRRATERMVRTLGGTNV